MRQVQCSTLTRSNKLYTLYYIVSPEGVKLSGLTIWICVVVYTIESVHRAYARMPTAMPPLCAR